MQHNFGMKTKSSQSEVIRPINGLERVSVWNHLIALKEDGLMLRFGYLIRSEKIKEYVQQINLNKDIALGLFVNEKLMGLAHGATYAENGWPVTEVGLSVDPSLQGKGWGTKLLDAAIEAAKIQNSVKVIVNTLTSNSAMRKILEKRGGRAVVDGKDLSVEFVLPNNNSNLEMNHYKIDGMEVIEKNVNRDGPKFLFVHGAGGDAWQWRSELMPKLAEGGANSIAFSLPYHGNSDEKKYEFGDYLKLIEKMHKIAGDDAIIVAHSMGGFLTQHYLAETKVRCKVVLISSMPPFNVANFDKGFLNGVSSNLKCTLARKNLHGFLNKVNPVDSEKIEAKISMIGGTFDKVIPIEWQRKSAFHYRSKLIELPGGHNLMNGITSNVVSKILLNAAK